ncbi:serpin B3-like [Oppia nitens]|uniref:serpin B3-like n=1 Tax=Oppia nitens TaxID=1686743 RepID=UPI0023DC6C14|nr:serpin B3-like [Oppia nitens]
MYLNRNPTGSNGDTEDELQKVLDIKAKTNLTALEESLKTQLKSIESQIDKEVNIRLANRILISNKSPLLKTFETFVDNIFNTHIKSANFMKNYHFLRAESNEWIKSETNNIFKKLFDNELSSNTSIALANSVFLEAFWKNAFTQKYTTKDNFFDETQPDGISVDTMKIWKQYKYIVNNSLDVMAIELPFRYESDISLVILMPNNGHGLDELTFKLDIHSLKVILNELDVSEEKKLVLSLPKFTIRSEYNLEDVFNGLGLKTLFDSTANLTDMTGDTTLHLSHGIHKAYIEIKEEGLQSSQLSQLLYSPSVQFNNHPFVRHFPIKVNKPFIFIIRDYNTDIMLAMGQLRTL